MAASLKKCIKVRERLSELLLEGMDVEEARHNVALEFCISYSSVERYNRRANQDSLVIAEGLENRPEHLPKVLIFDIETAPIKGYCWDIWQQNIGLNQIIRDWFVLSYSAKWLGVDGVIYKDLRGCVADEDDAPILGGMWNLLNDADLVITQNGNKFDIKKLNARFIQQGYQPPSTYKRWDSLIVAKREFGFTSNKLEYMTDKMCENKKLKHGKFPGFDLWTECMADNLEAWEEMEEYNRMDVVSLEELYHKFAAWDRKHPNYNLYNNPEQHTCRCGSTSFVRNGYAYTGVSKFQKYRCKECGAETRGRTNVFSKEERAGLHMNIAG